MSGKPTYAAIASSPPTKTNGDGSAGPLAQGQGASSSNTNSNSGLAVDGDAPPPYTAPNPNLIPNPHQTILPPQTQSQSYQHPHPHGQGHGNVEAQVGAWTQPPTAVAKARAQRRFWGAFFWAWAIWILVGMLIGGGVSDVSHTPHGHGHWDEHGDWKDDSGYTASFNSNLGPAVHASEAAAVPLGHAASASASDMSLAGSEVYGLNQVELAKDEDNGVIELTQFI